MSDFLTVTLRAILCLVFYLNVWLLLTLVKWHTCHLHVNTHGCASGHTTDVRHPRALVCVFFFLVVWFGHTNAWCTSTQQSQCHTNINTHTQIQSSHSFTYFPALLLLTTSPSNLWQTKLMWEQRDPPKMRTTSNSIDMGIDLFPSPSAQLEKRSRKGGGEEENDPKCPCWSECVDAAQRFPQPCPQIQHRISSQTLTSSPPHRSLCCLPLCYYTNKLRNVSI